jgi:hypothetical protein
LAHEIVKQQEAMSAQNAPPRNPPMESRWDAQFSEVKQMINARNVNETPPAPMINASGRPAGRGRGRGRGNTNYTQSGPPSAPEAYQAKFKQNLAQADNLRDQGPGSQYQRSYQNNNNRGRGGGFPPRPRRLPVQCPECFNRKHDPNLCQMTQDQLKSIGSLFNTPSQDQPPTQQAHVNTHQVDPNFQYEPAYDPQDL